MAHSSHTKSSVSIDFIQYTTTAICKKTEYNVLRVSQWIFSCLTGKNSRLSQIINTWTFYRLTPDGNEGVGVKISYLECTYGTKYYVINQVNGQINAIHDDSIELTDFTGRFSSFNLDELEIECMQTSRLSGWWGCFHTRCPCTTTANNTSGWGIRCKLQSAKHRRPHRYGIWLT